MLISQAVDGRIHVSREEVNYYYYYYYYYRSLDESDTVKR